MIWTLVYIQQAHKDAKKLASHQNSPPYVKLAGDLAGAYSRRINIQHRLVYQVLDSIKTVKVLRMWTHFG
ncbi:MAG: Txe/YoeB family addiction module toxin [Verrucomicrobia bacterium]|nr:Txe/YoeB family addiction module toxin [Verrucomicrobiota bacterium]